MAKQSTINNNKKRIRLSKKFEKKRLALKEKIYDKKLPMEERFDLVMKLADLPRNGAKTRIRNRCELTGRSRAYYRKFGICRLALRDLANKGEIPGLTKSSW
ncbi:MAG: 30S ribosomal protein S14 [Alphaproteobacteria bacterium]|jgi:small subunit ribosomal protein S14